MIYNLNIELHHILNLNKEKSYAITSVENLRMDSHAYRSAEFGVVELSDSVGRTRKGGCMPLGREWDI
jgi:hypothetical protein